MPPGADIGAGPRPLGGRVDLLRRPVRHEREFVTGQQPHPGIRRVPPERGGRAAPEAHSSDRSQQVGRAAEGIEKQIVDRQHTHRLTLAPQGTTAHPRAAAVGHLEIAVRVDGDHPRRQHLFHPCPAFQAPAQAAQSEVAVGDDAAQRADRRRRLIHSMECWCFQRGLVRRPTPRAART
ncbi:hypothetical protein D9753_03190 [Streptomyces dangxiongensis]|uniref:Uncharacterized protein n=1 Tax=Streptomyces dangxiongensis TaxID=1442032 RepID=A0A3G2J785_9ACTN|nr:hypothetical protein D9753_03190 [Streptomyces dangxiongensis]